MRAHLWHIAGLHAKQAAANYGKLATVLAVVEGGIDTQGCASDVLPVIA